jgi:hypothetical protein
MILLENNLICLEREKPLIRLWAIRECRRTAATLQIELVEMTTTRIRYPNNAEMNVSLTQEDQLKYPL